MVADNFVGKTFLCDGGSSRIDIGLIPNNLLSYVSEQSTENTIELFTAASRRGNIPVWSTIDIAKIKPIHIKHTHGTIQR